MNTTPRVIAAMAVAAITLAGATACSSLTPEERAAYLDQAAGYGKKAHDWIVSAGDQPTEARCGREFRPVVVPVPITPGDAEWEAEVRRVFVGACVSGQTPAPAGG